MADTLRTQPEPIRQAGELFAEKRQRLIELIAEELGGKPANATAVNPDEELRLWTHATSGPDQVFALRQKQAEEVGAMPSTATPKEKAELARHHDEEVMSLAFKYRFELGQSNGKNDPELEAKYHEKMFKKAVEAGLLSHEHLQDGHPLRAELTPAAPEVAPDQGWQWEGGQK